MILPCFKTQTTIGIIFLIGRMDNLWQVYGRGEGGYRAGYKIDFENRQIVFDQYLKATEIILEYKTQGIDDKGNAIVPKDAKVH